MDESVHARGTATSPHEPLGTPEVALAAVGQNGAALQHASLDLRGDLMVVLTAVHTGAMASFRPHPGETFRPHPGQLPL
jgi:hypothetical protein